MRVSGLIERVIVVGDYLLYLDSNIFSFGKVITVMNKNLILNQIVFKKICNLTYENLINTRKCLIKLNVGQNKIFNICFFNAVKHTY